MTAVLFVVSVGGVSLHTGLMLDGRANLALRHLVGTGALKEAVQKEEQPTVSQHQHVRILGHNDNLDFITLCIMPNIWILWSIQ